MIKKITLYLVSIVWLAGGLSCNNAEMELNSLFNPSEHMKIDTEFLIGEWNIVKFAYTADGNKISDVAAITNVRLVIQTITGNNPVRCNLNIEDIDLELSLSCVNWTGAYVSLSGNFINITHCGSTYLYAIPPHEEYDITFALLNAYSFIIRGDELILYFQGDDKDWRNSFLIKENKNLLILKKNKNN